MRPLACSFLLEMSLLSLASLVSLHPTTPTLFLLVLLSYFGGAYPPKVSCTEHKILKPSLFDFDTINM